MAKKFLIIQTAFIGDVILATAVIEKLHRFFPDAQIDFLLRKGNESLLANHPYLNRVIVWDKKKNKYGNLSGTISEVRKGKYDVVVNLHRFASSGLVTLASGAKERIGFAKNPFSFCYTHRFKHKIGKKGDKVFPHEVTRNLSLISHLTDDSFEMPKLYPSKGDFERVKVYASSPYITISPASVWFTKQVPANVWVDFIKAVKGYKIYLLGSADDEKLCHEIISNTGTGSAESLSGKLTLLQSAAQMSNAAMNYANDSAPLHLAGAMNAPVTEVYCSTAPEYGFGPLSEKAFIVQAHEELSCKPCGLHGHKVCPLGHFKCSRIEVVDLVMNLIPGPSPKEIGSAG